MDFNNCGILDTRSDGCHARLLGRKHRRYGTTFVHGYDYVYDGRDLSHSRSRHIADYLRKQNLLDNQCDACLHHLGELVQEFNPAQLVIMPMMAVVAILMAKESLELRKK